MNSGMSAKYREYNEVEGPIIADEAKADSLMAQLDATQKMAAMLSDEIARLSDRLTPVCQPVQTVETLLGVGIGNKRNEPSPAVQSIFRVKEILSNCEHQIRSIQMRLAV